LIKGIKVERNEIRVSMLQYADDTMFICKASLKNVLTIKSVLRCFELASGLKVNLHKSSLGGIGVQPTNMDTFSIILNCTKMSLPFIYLGIPIGGNHR